MRVADDERGRVPFALIGVLLVLGSVGAATVDLDGGRVDRDVRLAGDRAEAAAETALRDAVRDAGGAAAASPVAAPANTSAGRLIDPDRPFRSYYELLVALEVRERLGERGEAPGVLDGTRAPDSRHGSRTAAAVPPGSADQRVGRATARVHLEPVETHADAARAVENVTVERAGEGLVRATVEDVAVLVERDGRVVDRRAVTLNATVATPALELHDRTERFERRLDGGLSTPGSLTRGLTGGLYALGWARGWAQYAGLPIEDPLANRHAELVANLAVIDAQRSTFGTSDPGAERGLARATARVAADETVGVRSGGLVDAALPEPNADDAAPGDVASPDRRPVVVGVNGTADRALADVVRGAPRGVPGGDAAAAPLEELVRDAATVEGRVETATATRQRLPREHVAPENASEWRVSRGEPVRHVDAVRTIDDGPEPAAPAGWQLRNVTHRRVAIVERVPHTYVHERTGAVVERVRPYDVVVDVAVAAAVRPRPLPVDPGPAVGPPRGPASERLASRAERRLLEDVDAIAREAATGAAADRSVSVTPAELAEERDHVYDELSELREELRSVRTESTRSAAVTDEDPAAELRRTLAAERDAYVAAPERYANLTDRAAVAARAVYVRRTVERLEDRSAVQRATGDAIGDAAAEAGGLAAGSVDELLEVGTGYARPAAEPTNATPPAPDVRLSVDGGPSYLQRDAVAVEGRDATAHPLGVRTRTLPSLDTESVAGAVGDRLAAELFEGDETVPLPVAARALRRTEGVPESAAAGSGLARERARLADAVAERVDLLESRSAALVAAETGLDATAASEVVAEGTARWETPARRALAFESGNASAAVAAAAADRPAVSDRDADRLEVLLRDRVLALLGSEATHVEAAPLEQLGEAAREVARDVVADQASAAAERGLEEAADRLPERFDRLTVVGVRGAPVLPVPGYWVANVNAWHVEVRGGYERFAVSAPVGGPAAGGTVRYERDGQPVRLDVTGDGTSERLGRASRVTFDGSTTVVVAVPPSTGVGNADPSFAETSPGWDSWTGAEPEPFDAATARATDGGRPSEAGRG